MSADWEVQVAIYDALKADATLMGLVQGVYDEPPTNQIQNYIIIGDAVNNADDNHSRLGSEIYMNITIYTKPEWLGFYTAKNIFSRVDTLLNTKKLSLTNHTMLICEFDRHFTFKKEDIRGISARYKILTESNTQFTI